MSDYSELKKLAVAATPQNFDSAENKDENGYAECPCCGGEGAVLVEADYCNYDNVALGVQFYGIGNEFGAAEAYYRAANPAAVMALIAENEKLKTDLREQKDAKLGLSWAIGEIMGGRDQLRIEVEALRKDAERYKWTTTEGNWVARMFGKWRSHTGEYGDANPTEWFDSREQAIDAAITKGKRP